MDKKAALLLSGLLHFESNKTINEKKYVANIKKNIVEYFNEYKIDIYLSTNNIEKNILNDFYETYDIIVNNDNNTDNMVLNGIELIINNIKNKNITYDFVVVTKLDIYFTNEFNNINLDKFNAIFSENGVFDNNFYLIPIKYLEKFYELLTKINNNESINLTNALNSHFEMNYINFNYQFNFFNDIQFKINKYQFSEDVWYNSIGCNSLMKISDEVIYLNKIINAPRHWCWIGYDIIDKGYYNLTFEILSNRDIENFDFIKLHNPVKFYKTQNIKANIWTKIDIIINVRENYDYLVLIFDDFNDTINLQFKNIKINNTNKMLIINELNNNTFNIKSNKCILNKFSDSMFEFIKYETDIFMPFVWCGYNIKAEKVKTIMSFDIMFKSDVPLKSDNLFIKTHDPVEHYNDWLTQCVKNEFVHIELPLYMSKNKQLVIFIMDECFKHVHFIVKNIKFIPDKLNYKFISFYTQGEPYDKCFNLTNASTEYKNKIEPYVDIIKMYNAYELKSNPETEYLVKEFEFESKYNPKINLIGYNRWKPSIILDALEELNEGDILYYRDCNVEKYKTILYDIDRTISLLNFVLNDFDIFLPVENYPHIFMKYHIKKEVFKYINCFNNNFLDDYLFNNSIVILRKSKLSIKYIKECIEMCRNDDLLNCNIITKQHNEFKWHCPEQSIMGLLFKKYLNSNLNFHYIQYSMNNRIFTQKKIIRIDNSFLNKNCCIIVTGQLRVFKNNQYHLINMLLQTEKQYLNLLVIFVLNSETNEDMNFLKKICDEKCINNIIVNYNVDQYKNIFSNFNSKKILNEKYIKIKNNYLNQNNNAKKEISDVNNFLFNSSIQYHQLQIGIDNLYKYEKENNICFDIIMRTRFDVYYQELFYPKVYNDNDDIFYKVFFNNININLFQQTCERLQINTNTINSLLLFLQQQKIELPNDRINFDLINVTLGGWNYYNSLSLKNIINGNNDILYAYNDFFYFGKREVFLKLHNLFDDCFLLDNGSELNINHIYSPESQLIMYCVKNNIQILMYDENTRIYNGSFGLIRNI